MSYQFKTTAKVYNCKENNIFKSFSDMMMELEDSFSYENCILQGFVDTWSFKDREIAPMHFFSVVDAVYYALQHSDCWDGCSVELEKGVLKLSAPHHDGTNTFTIKILNDKGLKVVYNNKDYKGYIYRQPKNYWFGKIAL